MNRPDDPSNSVKALKEASWQTTKILITVNVNVILYNTQVHRNSIQKSSIYNDQSQNYFIFETNAVLKLQKHVLKQVKSSELLATGQNCNAATLHRNKL